MNETNPSELDGELTQHFEAKSSTIQYSNDIDEYIDDSPDGPDDEFPILSHNKELHEAPTQIQFTSRELLDNEKVLLRLEPNLDNNDCIFDGTGQSIELITTDGQKLRLIADYSDALDLSTAFIAT